MSKLSQIHAELEEQATELGYESLIKALEDGWVPDYEQRTLHKPVDLQEQAHADWLKERDEILNSLGALLNAINGKTYNSMTNYEASVLIKKSERVLSEAIEFIKKGEV